MGMLVMGFGVSMCPHAEAWGQLPVRGNGPKARPMAYHWTSRAMRMKTVNHKPINHPKKNH
ncbi:MAG: hypothetical protein ACP5HY_10530, partial [Caldivirga sp.]